MARKPAFISHSREREAQIQGRMLDAIEAKFRRQIAAQIADESNRIVSAYAEIGYVPPVSDASVDGFRAIYRQLCLTSAKMFGSRIISAGKANGHSIETKEQGLLDFFQALANAWINYEMIRRRIQSVSDTTREQIVRQVAQGQEQGLTLAEIVLSIRENIPGMSRVRATVIARTEAHGAANYAAHETARSTGVDYVKEWVSVHDHRTRSVLRDDEYDHLAMDGQTRDMNEPFNMPNALGLSLPCQYPGDPTLPPGAVINCRCVVVHGVKSFD